jgi:tricorn protease
MGNWEGAVIQHGDDRAARYRLATWLHDGKRLATISDATGEEALEVHQADASVEPAQLNNLDIGRAFTLVAAPKQAQIALANHRNELILVDLDAGAARVLDRSRHSRINGIAWSPDGRWLAYGFSDTQRTSIIKLCRVETGDTYPITRPVLFDGHPAFDPEGKYLYFLSFRDFDPVYDNMHFDLGFPWGVRPFLITLQADLPSPFIPVPRPLDKQDSKAGNDQSRGEHNVTAKGKDEKAEERPLQIDLDGIAGRIVAFPVPAARYTQIRGIKGKALFSSVPLEGALNQNWFPEHGPPAKGKLEAYSFEDQNRETLVDGISGFDLAQDNKTLIYRAGQRLRVIKAGEKPNGDHNTPPSRKSGWLNLGRIKISVEPLAEWKQMYREAWRLQRDQFWTEDMSGIDWQEVYTRYLPLLDRVATRAEFSDLLWEMQGELGTSHAYELGGDYRPEPRYPQGFLGADFAYDAETDSYRVVRIIQGDPWDETAGSPLTRPGVNVKPGDRLIAINGRKVSLEAPPAELLVHQANSEALLTFAGANGEAPRTCSVKTLRDETPARYREWVETNRQAVHAATEGRVGYVHVPDMGPRGFAEFHRGYLAEIGREGLIVDVRFNGGGHVSQLLLEKLARKRLGYDIQRWGEPSAYPTDSVMGPIVALTNEHAGSDGDIFSHSFKIMQLGPLIGKRTWGGVIGIHPRDILADGGVTTQPEFSFWFSDVGWQIENYGTDPDIDIDIRPQDYASGHDPQLDRALVEIKRLLEEQPPTLPDFGARPRLSLPKLPES